MDSIKFLGRLLAELHQFQGTHPKALCFDPCENLPDQSSTHRIRFDNRQCLFDHRSPPFAASACNVAATSRPMLAGLRQTRMPAASMAAILPAAVPCPPEIIAPACPM